MTAKREPGRPGRPKLGPEKRTIRVRMNLTPAEFAGLLEECIDNESPGSAARRKLFYDEDDEE